MIQMTAAAGSALDHARAISGLIAEEAAASEQLGRLTDRVATAMLDANLFQVMVPPRDGGRGESRVMFFRMVEEIARADGSAGWCASVCNAVTLAASLGLPAEGRAELFGNGPVACWAQLAPNTVATPAPGGYRVTGKGAFGSGSSLSRWVLVASPFEPTGPNQPRFRAYFVSKDDVDIQPGSWDVMGLRGTASLDYTITDRFVPAHRTFEYGFSEGHGPLGVSVVETTRLNAIGLAAFACGVAQHALSELIASATRTKRIAAEGMQADDNQVQYGLGELDGRLKAARAYLVGLVARMDEAAAQDRPLGHADAIAILQATQTLARAARDTVVFAFDNVGTSVVYARYPLQRCLRDVFTGLKHASFTPAILGRIGKVRLGKEYGGSAF